MRRVKCTLYVYCHGLSKASAPLRVSYNKLNPSHCGRGRGRGRPGCGVEGWRRPQTSGLSPGHQAGHRPPCTAHQSPWTFGLVLFRRLDCERRKTQFSVDSAGAYRWAGEQDSQAWVGGAACSSSSGPGPGSTLPLAPSDSIPGLPPGGQMAVAAGASGPLGVKPSRTEQAFPQHRPARAHWLSRGHIGLP